MNEIVLLACLGAGALIILAAIKIALKKEDWQSAFVPLGIGAVLMSGSLFQTIKITPKSLELTKATAAAAGDVATETANIAAALRSTQAQLTALTDLLRQKNMLQPQEVRTVEQPSATRPPVDIAKIQRARMTLDRLRKD
jgi:hypothetical protein